MSTTISSSINEPKDLFERLSRGVIDQTTALQQISVALFKHIQGIKVGNILLVGNSGTGKTTIMRTIEAVFGEDPALAVHMNTVRMNANIVADDESPDLESSVILERLSRNAIRLMGDQASPERFRKLMENGVVFLDEVDKIRAHVGDRANARGILAQESLLTLIEGEAVGLPLAHRNEAGELVESKVYLDTSRILFICGGAFEGLYDMVYRRVAGGETKDKLVQEFVVAEQEQDLEEKIHFSLKDYVRYEDMFAYGMTPQFLGRFDEIIVLNDLTVDGLMRVFVEPSESMYRQARAYFRGLGIELQITKEALRHIAELAHENHRLGARALRMVFKRVLRGIEFNPKDSWLVQEKDGKRVLTINRDWVKNTG